jgi:hypothetical protein
MLHQPGMLVLLAEAQADAAAELLSAGHLALDATALGTALAQGGPAALVAQRLAAQCDAVVGRASPSLAPVLRALRRPAYASAALVPPARATPADRVPAWCDMRLLLAASRALDR